MTHGSSIGSIVAICLLFCLLDLSAAFAVYFFSSGSYNDQEEVDQWLASPNKVTHRDFASTPAATPPKSQNIKDRVLILTPLKDASSHLQHHFALLANLTYPHHLIDLGFIVGDTTDDTRAVLDAELDKSSKGQASSLFRSCTIVHKDLGDVRSQDVASRHGFQAQVKRRKKLAIVRNALLKETLKGEHQWVYWRDVDVAESPATILEDFIAHDKDVLTPSKSTYEREVVICSYRQMCGSRGSRKAQCLKVAVGIYFSLGMVCRIAEHNPLDDYNSWQETPKSEVFKDKLDTEVIVVEGSILFLVFTKKNLLISV